MVVREPFRGKNQDRLAGTKVPIKTAWCGEVLGEIQAAVAFLLVDKFSEPIGLMPVTAIVQHNDAGNSWIRMPDQPFVVHLGMKLKRRIFMMQRVIITAGNKGTNGQRSLRRGLHRAPGESDD